MPRIKIPYIILLILIFFVGSGFNKKEDKNRFLLGVSKVEITPPVGYPQYRGKSTGIGSPLYAKALVFKQNENYGAILICDLINIPRDLSRIVRKEVSVKASIPFQNISICATHTHTGPILNIENYANHEIKGTLTKEDKNSYISKLINNMVECIVDANNHMQPSELIIGKGITSEISFNRRFLMKNGKVRFNPGCLNPEIVKTTGPIDPDVDYILFKSTSENIVNASLSVFACHTDTQGDTLFHADYPYYLEKKLQNIFSEKHISVFGMGASGNINHIDVSHAIENTKRGWITEIIGNELAQSIKESVPQAKKYKPDLKIITSTIYLPMQEYNQSEYEWSINKNAQPLFSESLWLSDKRRQKIIKLENLRKREAIQPSVSGDPWRLPIEIHIFKLNSETAVVTLPGEIFTELGLDLKRRSPFINTILIELANSDILYVPTLQAFSEGDYEPVYSVLTPGSGEIMIDKVVQLLNSLY